MPPALIFWILQGGPRAAAGLFVMSVDFPSLFQIPLAEESILTSLAFHVWGNVYAKNTFNSGTSIHEYPAHLA